MGMFLFFICKINCVNMYEKFCKMENLFFELVFDSKLNVGCNINM